MDQQTALELAVFCHLDLVMDIALDLAIETPVSHDNTISMYGKPLIIDSLEANILTSLGTLWELGLCYHSCHLSGLIHFS